MTTLPFDPNRDKTKTIEILKPIPTTTITTSYVGVTTSYLTKTAPIGETATVIVDIPYHTTTTVTSKWTGTITSTTTHTNPTDSIDTVIVQVHCQTQLLLPLNIGLNHLLPPPPLLDHQETLILFNQRTTEPYCHYNRVLVRILLLLVLSLLLQVELIQLLSRNLQIQLSQLPSTGQNLTLPLVPSLLLQVELIQLLSGTTKPYCNHN